MTKNSNQGGGPALIVKHFQSSVFPDTCCMILCSNGVLDAACHKHFFCDFLSHLNCSVLRGLAMFGFCMFLFVITTIVFAIEID